MAAVRARHAGRNDVVGPRTLLGIGRLERADAGEPGRGHAGPGEDAAALHPGRRGDHRHPVDPPPAALLEQQRNIEHDQPMGAVAPQEIALQHGHRGMDQPLQPGECRLVVEHRVAERPAVDAADSGRAGKQRLDMGDQAAARTLQRMHRGVRVEHRHARLAEHRRDRRLAHADRPGEAQDDGHATSSARSSASCARGAGCPKNFSNATAAWPINIASPSIAGWPRARASASSGVSNGA